MVVVWVGGGRPLELGSRSLGGDVVVIGNLQGGDYVAVITRICMVSWCLV